MLDQWNADRPRLVLAYLDSIHAAQTARFFRRQGWEVRLTPSADEAYRLVDTLDPTVVVVDADLPDESGWLVSAKITLDHPEKAVVLLGTERTAGLERRRAQVRASALVLRHEGVEGLAEEILERCLLHA